MSLNWPQSTSRHSRTTVGQKILLLREQTDFDFITGQCLVPDENSACWIPVRHKTLSDGDVKVCVSYDNAWLEIGASAG